MQATSTTTKTTNGFIVRFRDRAYIVAPAGYASRADGTVYRDGTDPNRSSPEIGRRRYAYVFRTARAAARQANKFAGPTMIIPL